MNSIRLLVGAIVLLSYVNGKVASVIRLNIADRLLSSCITISSLFLFSCELAFAAPVVLAPTATATTVTAPSVPSLYDTYSIGYDKINSGRLTSILGIDTLREIAGSRSSGSVLEVAVGSGLQLPYYNYDAILSYTGIDNSVGMLANAKDKVKETQIKHNKLPISFNLMDADDMKFDSNTFDTVIDTFSMCVFDQPDKVLKEMTRVVKPKGQVILLENSISRNAMLASIEHVVEPIITPFSKGCKLDVDVPALAHAAGLVLIQENVIQGGSIYMGIYAKK